MVLCHCCNLKPIDNKWKETSSIYNEFSGLMYPTWDFELRHAPYMTTYMGNVEHVGPYYVHGPQHEEITLTPIPC